MRFSTILFPSPFSRASFSLRPSRNVLRIDCRRVRCQTQGWGWRRRQTPPRCRRSRRRRWRDTRQARPNVPTTTRSTAVWLIMRHFTSSRVMAAPGITTRSISLSATVFAAGRFGTTRFTLRQEMDSIMASLWALTATVCSILAHISRVWFNSRKGVLVPYVNTCYNIYPSGDTFFINREGQYIRHRIDAFRFGAG